MNLTAPPSLAWPDPGEVHIWQLPCAAAQAAKPLWQSWLNPTEQAQVERYRRAPDRDRAILSRGGLRYLLASYLNEPPHELQLATQCHGKPYLVSNADAIQFNVAHSGTWVVYGFTRQAQIGVDVETVCPRPRLSSLIKKCLTPSEQETLTGSEAMQLQGFLQYWTLKEAHLKATGWGLGYPPQAIEVALQPCPRVLCPAPTDNPAAQTWWVQLWQPEPTTIAAVCCSGAQHHLKIRSLNNSGQSAKQDLT